jgi:hypothetical protein
MRPAIKAEGHQYPPVEGAGLPLGHFATKAKDRPETSPYTKYAAQ